jgi:hypothetical protein
MDRAIVRWSALVVALLAGEGVARPDDGASAAAGPGLDERTAFLVGAHTLKLGILAFEYGFSDRVSIGSDPPFWLARAALPVLIPNLHVKELIFQRQPVTVSAEVGGYVADLQSNSNASGWLIAAPLSLFASYELNPRIWLHGEGTYEYVRAFGAGDLERVNVGGAVASQTVQLAGMFQLRVTRVLSLTASGRYQVYTANLAFNGTSDLDPYTSVTVSGRAMPAAAHPWQAIGGIALLWKHVHLILGAGYGYYFIPGVQLAYPQKTFVPDASFSVLL